MNKQGDIYGLFQLMGNNSPYPTHTLVVRLSFILKEQYKFVPVFNGV